jgi:hypothetical protein
VQVLVDLIGHAVAVVAVLHKGDIDDQARQAGVSYLTVMLALVAEWVDGAGASASWMIGARLACGAPANFLAIRRQRHEKTPSQVVSMIAGVSLAMIVRPVKILPAIVKSCWRRRWAGWSGRGSS